jgi:hypothetical protein
MDIPFRWLLLQTRRPLTAFVKDGDDFEAVATQPVRDHIRRIRNHQFPGARNSAGPTKIRQRRESFDRGQKRQRDSGGSGRVLARDVSAKVSKVGDRAR